MTATSPARGAPVVLGPPGPEPEARGRFGDFGGRFVPETLIPAPETAHAIRGAIDEALAARESGEERVILFNYSGHGLLDLAAYDAHLHGQLMDV